MKISEYETKQSLSDNNLFLMETSDGTRTILAKELASALLGIIKPGDLKSVTNIAATDKILIGTSAGIKTIPASDALFAYLDSIATVEMRRNIFRGKKLGTRFTSFDANNIHNNFKGQFIGDYWEWDNNIWRIVDFNYFYMKGNLDNEYDILNALKNHIVIMPDKHLKYTVQWNTSPTTVASTGYYDSNVKSVLYELEDAYLDNSSSKYFINDDYLYFHYDYFTSKDSSYSAEWSFDDGFDLPNEMQITGSFILTPNYKNQRYTICNTQFSLMQHCPIFINPYPTSVYWLRDIDAENNKALYVDNSGIISKASPYNGYDVRPYFVAYGNI